MVPENLEIFWPCFQTAVGLTLNEPIDKKRQNVVKFHLNYKKAPEGSNFIVLSQNFQKVRVKKTNL